jgi:hypothetical protein
MTSKGAMLLMLAMYEKIKLVLHGMLSSQFVVSYKVKEQVCFHVLQLLDKMLAEKSVVDWLVLSTLIQLKLQSVCMLGSGAWTSSWTS